MKRAVSLWGVVLGLLVFTSGVASATPVFDDFSSDTSSSYIGSNAVGCCGSFSVDTGGDGVLLIAPNALNTYSVVRVGSSLGVGETFHVDVGRVDSDRTSSFAMITTSLAQPDGVSSFGFRFRRDDGDTIIVERLSDGSDVMDATVAEPSQSDPLTFWIDRTTTTDFSFYYSPVGSANRTLVGNSSLLASEVTTDLHVGVQSYRHLSATPSAYEFDNLVIVPEPTTALLLTLGLAGLGMRRRLH